MEEKTLKRLALLCAIVGFITLAIVATIQEPENISTQARLPEDTTFKFTAIITGVRETAHGSSLSLEREVIEQGFIDTKVPDGLIGQEATLTGSVTDGFFSISKIEVERNINES
ncbi:MAG: hypothetical protein ACQESE_02095 [Nanobdellota archaeon]